MNEKDFHKLIGALKMEAFKEYLMKAQLHVLRTHESQQGGGDFWLLVLCGLIALVIWFLMIKSWFGL